MFKTFNLRISFIADLKNDLASYTDFNYAKLIHSQKSINSYIFIVFSRLLFHQLKFLSIVILLLIKTKYIAIIKAKKKALYITQFLTYPVFCLSSKFVNLFINNNRVILLTKNFKFY